MMLHLIAHSDDGKYRLVLKRASGSNLGVYFLQKSKNHVKYVDEKKIGANFHHDGDFKYPDGDTRIDSLQKYINEHNMKWYLSNVSHTSGLRSVGCQ